MMQRERVTEDVYVFISDQYVQVTAGVIVTDEGLVVIDTLLYPEETRQMLKFIRQRLSQPIRYIINTHHHADHTTGTCFFDSVPVVAHRLCRDYLMSRGRESLERAKDRSTEMAEVQLVLPDIVFDDTLVLRVGNKTLHLQHTPGHSMDSIVVWIEEDNILFAADTVMPLPYFVDGNYDAFMESLLGLSQRKFEAIVQGHGEIMLRGEVSKRLREDIRYLEKLGKRVDEALATTDDPADLDDLLDAIVVNECGKKRILLNGVVQELHYQNVRALAAERRQALKR